MKYLRTTKITPGLLVVGLFSTVLVGCIYEVGVPAGEEQFGRWLPIQGMHQQSKVKDQMNQPKFRDDQPEGMRYPPAETVPVDGTPRDDRPDRTESAQLENPVPLTDDNLEYGEFLYQEQCAVCHGMAGHGQGTIPESGEYAPTVPSLHTGPQREQTDGEIYHTITHGTNQMWSYENNLTDMERWAVVNYVRALQRAEFPDPRDLERIHED